MPAKPPSLAKNQLCSSCRGGPPWREGAKKASLVLRGCRDFVPTRDFFIGSRKSNFFVTLYILRTQYTRITFGKAECAHMKGSSLQFCLLNQSCFKLPPRILLPSSGLYSKVQEDKKPSDEKTFPLYLSQRSVSPEDLRPSNRNVLPEKKPRSCSHQLRMSGGLQPPRCSEASPERKQSRSGKHIWGCPTAPPTILFPPTTPDINYRACFLSH